MLKARIRVSDHGGSDEACTEKQAADGNFFKLLTGNLDQTSRLPRDLEDCSIPQMTCENHLKPGRSQA